MRHLDHVHAIAQVGHQQSGCDKPFHDRARCDRNHFRRRGAAQRSVGGRIHPDQPRDEGGPKGCVLRALFGGDGRGLRRVRQRAGDGRLDRALYAAHCDVVVQGQPPLRAHNPSRAVPA